MKAKTLLIAAATLAVGAITSQAQVYSQNVVGYINLSLTNGYNMIGNQLDFDGTGTNNTVQSFFGTNLVAPSQVLVWNPGTASFPFAASWVNSKGTLKWTGNTNAVNAALQLGGGIFVQSPSATTITIVGTVLQGTNIIALTPNAYNLVSSVSPVGGLLQSNLNYTPSVGDKVIPWDPTSQGYPIQYSYVNNKGTLKWSPSQPTINVGQAVFIQTSASTSSWTNILNIQ
jgi:hypothetical protein